MPPTDGPATSYLDTVHCRAICDEIGDRLREVLRRDIQPLSAYLSSLIEQFDELKSVPAPSIVPEMETGPSPKVYMLEPTI